MEILISDIKPTILVHINAQTLTNQILPYNAQIEKKQANYTTRYIIPEPGNLVYIIIYLVYIISCTYLDPRYMCIIVKNSFKKCTWKFQAG